MSTWKSEEGKYLLSKNDGVKTGHIRLRHGEKKDSVNTTGKYFHMIFID